MGKLDKVAEHLARHAQINIEHVPAFKVLFRGQEDSSKGEHLVVYYAEDIPHPGQLRLAEYQAATGEFAMPSELGVIPASAGDMFMGALIPGLLLGVLYMLFVVLVGIFRPDKIPGHITKRFTEFTVLGVIRHAGLLRLARSPPCRSRNP